MSGPDFGQIRSLIGELSALTAGLGPFDLVDTIGKVLRAISTPPPGDPEGLEQLAAAFRAAGRDLDDLAGDLRVVAARALPARWRSPAGAKARDVVTATAHLVAAPRPAFDHVADALDRHADYVRELRRRHAQLHEELREALHDATHVSIRVEVLGVGFGFGAPLPDLTALAGLVAAAARLVVGCVEVYERSLWSAENLARTFTDVAGNARAGAVGQPGMTAGDAVVLADRPRPTAARLRVFNLNIGQGFGNGIGDDRGTDPGELGRIAQLIIDGDADVATLQEVFAKDLPELERELERRTGDRWTLHFGEASSKIQAANWWRAGEPFGNAVAVRLGDDIASSRQTDLVKLDEPGDDGLEGRSMTGVEIRTAHGGTLDVFTAHTAHSGEGTLQQRADQISRVVDAVRDNPDPAVVTGDFNAAVTDDTPAGHAVREFGQHGYTDAGNAGPTIGGSRRIDYVFTSPDVDPGRPAVVDGAPSDHDGIVVDIDVPAAR